MSRFTQQHRRCLTRLAALLCGVSMLLLSGCAGSFIQTIQISSMAQKKQHHEIIQTLQTELDQQKTLPAFHLFLLSGAYYEIRDYRRCLATVRLLQNRIDQGETAYLGGNLTPYPQILQGYVHLDQGEYAQAIQYASKAYALIDTPAGRGNFFFRSQLIQIAEVAGVAQALLNHSAEAQRWLAILRSIPIDSSILGPEKYTAIARINMALKDYQEALAAIRNPQATITGLTTAFYDQTFQELPRFFIETKALYETGAIDQAKQRYDQLLQHPRIKEIGSMYWPVLFDRARIARRDRDARLAMHLLQEAIEVVELQRATIATEAGRIGFVGDKQALYREMVDLQLQSGRFAQAFEYAERAKSRALVDLLASAGAKLQPTDAPQVRTTIARLNKAEQEQTIISDATTRSVSVEQTRTLIASLKKELVQEDPQYASLVSVTGFDMRAIQHSLLPDESLLEYYGNGQNWYVFIVQRDTVWGTKLTLPELDTTVQQLRVQLAMPQSSGYHEPAHRLFRQLIAPVRDRLTERLVVVPHGTLHYLPFNVLEDDSGAALIDNRIIRILPAADIALYLKPAGTAWPLQALILGNPQLSAPNLTLVHAQEEAKAIAALLTGSHLLLGPEATADTLIRRAGTFKRLHIAAHGVFDADEPLNSALLLARGAHDDGLLRAADLYHMQLTTDLVTLSACETALSKIARGDDLLGFTRGFLYAGARSIVASLWKVDDLSTRDLMLVFYRNLTGMDKARALAEAQRALKRQYPHPFYWAAFQLTGAAD